jgi:hypothetical protein
MTAYILCTLPTGLVLNSTPAATPEPLQMPNQFWVAVQPDANGNGDWQEQIPFDAVCFAPATPLPSVDSLPADGSPLVLTAAPGDWLHHLDDARAISAQRAQAQQKLKAKFDQQIAADLANAPATHG